MTQTVYDITAHNSNAQYPMATGICSHQYQLCLPGGELKLEPNSGSLLFNFLICFLYL